MQFVNLNSKETKVNEKKKFFTGGKKPPNTQSTAILVSPYDFKVERM